MRVRMLQEAKDEAQEATRWYEKKRQGLGDEFLDALTDALRQVEQYPQRHALVPDIPSGREVRRVLLQRFPYKVVYEVRSDVILVLAVAHSRRRPGYWKSRNGEATEAEDNPSESK